MLINYQYDYIINTIVSIIADLQCLSSIGKDTLNTGRIGSITYEVANTSDRPVLVIRMRPIFAVPAT